MLVKCISQYLCEFLCIGASVDHENQEQETVEAAADMPYKIINFAG